MLTTVSSWISQPKNIPVILTLTVATYAVGSAISTFVRDMRNEKQQQNSSLPNINSNSNLSTASSTSSSPGRATTTTTTSSSSSRRQNSKTSKQSSSSSSSKKNSSSKTTKNEDEQQQNKMNNDVSTGGNSKTTTTMKQRPQLRISTQEETLLNNNNKNTTNSSSNGSSPTSFLHHRSPASPTNMKNKSRSIFDSTPPLSAQLLNSFSASFRQEKSVDDNVFEAAKAFPREQFTWLDVKSGLACTLKFQHAVPCNVERTSHSVSITLVATATNPHFSRYDLVVRFPSSTAVIDSNNNSSNNLGSSNLSTDSLEDSINNKGNCTNMNNKATSSSGNNNNSNQSSKMQKLMQIVAEEEKLIWINNGITLEKEERGVKIPLPAKVENFQQNNKNKNSVNNSNHHYHTPQTLSSLLSSRGASASTVNEECIILMGKLLVPEGEGDENAKTGKNNNNNNNNNSQDSLYRTCIIIPHTQNSVCLIHVHHSSKHAGSSRFSRPSSVISATLQSLIRLKPVSNYSSSSSSSVALGSSLFVSESRSGISFELPTNIQSMRICSNMAEELHGVVDIYSTSHHHHHHHQQHHQHHQNRKRKNVVRVIKSSSPSPRFNNNSTENLSASTLLSVRSNSINSSSPSKQSVTSETTAVSTSSTTTIPVSDFNRMRSLRKIKIFSSHPSPSSSLSTAMTKTAIHQKEQYYHVDAETLNFLSNFCVISSSSSSNSTTTQQQQQSINQQQMITIPPTIHHPLLSVEIGKSTCQFSYDFSFPRADLNILSSSSNSNVKTNLFQEVSVNFLARRALQKILSSSLKNLPTKDIVKILCSSSSSSNYFRNHHHHDSENSVPLLLSPFTHIVPLPDIQPIRLRGYKGISCLYLNENNEKEKETKHNNNSNVDDDCDKDCDEYLLVGTCFFELPLETIRLIGISSFLRKLIPTLETDACLDNNTNDFDERKSDSSRSSSSSSSCWFSIILHEKVSFSKSRKNLGDSFNQNSNNNNNNNNNNLATAQERFRRLFESTFTSLSVSKNASTTASGNSSNSSNNNNNSNNSNTNNNTTGNSIEYHATEIGLNCVIGMMRNNNNNNNCHWGVLEPSTGNPTAIFYRLDSCGLKSFQKYLNNICSANNNQQQLTTTNQLHFVSTRIRQAPSVYELDPRLTFVRKYFSSRTKQQQKAFLNKKFTSHTQREEILKQETCKNISEFVLSEDYETLYINKMKEMLENSTIQQQFNNNNNKSSNHNCCCCKISTLIFDKWGDFFSLEKSTGR